MTLRRRLRRWRRTGIRRAWRPGFGALALALAGLVPATAGAAAWAPPRALSDAGSAPINLGATAGFAPNGGAVILWHSAHGVDAVVHPARRGFGQARTIPGSSLSMPDLRPRLAFDAAGAALAVWSYFEPHPRFVQDGYAVDYTFGLRVASRGRSGTFGRAQTLTDNLDADPSADAAFDHSGNAVVVWTDAAGMHAAARKAGEQRFGHAQIVSQQQADPQVTVGRDGQATAAWSTRGRVHAASARRGAAFGSAVALRIPGLGRSKPAIAVDGRAAVTAAWSTRGRVMAATCSTAGSCSQPRALSPRGERAANPRVAVAADGTAVIAWSSSAGVSAALRDGHGGFGRPSRLAALGHGARANDVAVTVGPRGDAAAMWVIHSAAGDRVQAALRHGAHARFATASTLTPSVTGAECRDPQVVLDGHGDALAVWGLLTDGHPSIQATTFRP